MNKIFPIVLLFLIIAFSGCTGSDLSTEVSQIDAIKFDRANLNLDGKIVDVKLFPADARAGEEITAQLVVANTGTETINKETIEIKAKVKSLDDAMANVALGFMGDDKKTRTFTMDFEDEIKPGMVKTLTAVFRTQQELQGKNLAGKYVVTLILSVNGQKVAAKGVPVTLGSGKPREFTPVPTPPPTSTPTPTPTPTPTQAPEITESPTPTPTPTPEPVVTGTPTGEKIYARVMAYRFTESNKQINLGDAILWDNLDDERYTLVEVDGKMANVTLVDKYTQLFNTTGNYRFFLYYKNWRPPASYINITVKVNASS